MQLPGRTVLLTGASGGLGRAMARALAARGASLVLTGRRSDALASLAAETGGRAVACDLGDPTALERLASSVAGEVDVLVANAALPASGRLASFTVEELDRALAVNLRAPMVLARALVPPMTARGNGHLVFINSLSGKAASIGSSVYSGTKFGLRGFALALREDLHGTGIAVSSLYPGFVSDAGMFADAGGRLPPFVGTRTPEAVAAAVVRAIEQERTELDVAPLGLRAGAALAGLLPGPVAAVQRRLGAARVAADLAVRQRDKR